MRETELIYQSLEAIEKNYHVQIVIKDCYTIMRLRPAFTALLQRFYKHAGMYCMSRKQHPDTENACIQFGNTVMGRRMNADMRAYQRGACVTCPFGVEEFYYPIRCAGHVIGALLMGYWACGDKEYVQSAHFSEYTQRTLYRDDVCARQKLSEESASAAYRELALCGELLSMLCDKYLSELHIDVLFRYDFIFDNSTSYLYPTENLPFVSGTIHGENRKMTVILNAIYYIQEHYTKKITVEEIAKYCFCSSSTLSHIFAQNYGMTIGRLIQNIRCEHAKALLRESGMSVGQIALECGFATPDYFTVVFKGLMGMTPTEYRELPAEQPSL